MATFLRTLVRSTRAMTGSLASSVPSGSRAPARAGQIGPVRREIIFEPVHEQPGPREPSPVEPPPSVPETEPREPVPDRS